jgi:hypothetical protein
MAMAAIRGRTFAGRAAGFPREPNITPSSLNAPLRHPGKVGSPSKISPQQGGQGLPDVEPAQIHCRILISGSSMFRREFIAELTARHQELEQIFRERA